MPYSGPEYWEVIYRAVGDFGDLIRKAAEARAALDALKKSSLAEGQAEATAARTAADARKTDIAAIGEQRRALDTLAMSAKQAQVWTEWGGRSTPEAHLSDLERELSLRTLINRQAWLGFTSPQQAFAWRTNELNQRKLMNYAEWAGYQTADQYLSYLQKQRSGLAALNEVLLQRVSVYKENTDAALSYANALRGTHSSVGQLGEGLDLSGVSQFNAALQGLPDVVSTQLNIDDSDALGELARYEALLQAVPHAETTVLSASQIRGAVPVGRPGTQVIPVAYAPAGPVPEGQVRPEVIPVSYGGPYQQEYARILAQIAELNRLRAEIPVDFHIDPTEVAALHAKLGQLSVPETVVAHLVSQGGGAGGGGGPPPVAPAPGADEPPGDAAAKWAALAVSEKDAGAAADASVVKLAALKVAAAGDAEGAAKLAYVYQTLVGAEKAAGDRAAALVPKLDMASSSLRISGSALGFAQQHFSLFAGALGSTAFIGTVTGLHIALDGIVEVLALLVPSLATAAIGLLGWGAAAARSGQQVYNQMKNVLTVSSALNTTVPPLTGNFQQLMDAVRPQVFQLFGDALDLLNSKTGVFQTLIMKTGRVLDEFGARIVVDMQRGGKGLQTFFSTGEKVLAGLGQLLVPLGAIFSNLIKATEKTHIAEDLLAIADALAKLLVIVTSIPTPLLALVLGLHGLSLWGGLAVTGLSKLAISLVSAFGAVGPLNGAMTALAAKLGATDAQLVKIAEHSPAVKAVADAMGKNADSVAQFAVAAGKGEKSVSELATETSNGAVLAERYGAGLEKSGQEAVNLAIAAGATETQVAKVASGFATATAEGGFFAGLLAKVGGLSRLATGGLLALAAAAAVFAYKSLTARDASQRWIDSINKGLASQSLFTVIGKNMSDLAAVTDRLSHSQGLNAQAVHELAGAQSELSGNLALALPRIGGVSKAYGVDMVGALELLNLAGVKTSDLFTRQGLVWQTDLQMVKGLIDGYKAMGQQLGTVGSDLNVLLVSESDQLKSMGRLNTAWDNFQKLVSAPQDTIIQLGLGLQQFATDAKAAGASMLGLSPPSLKLQQDFQANYGNVEKLFDAFRAAQAVDGGVGNFTKFVKDAVAALIPLAGTNKAAAAEISQLAQEAGGPATTNLATLAHWAGNVKDPMLALYRATQQQTVASSNLSADAAKLSNTLQSELNPAMAKAAFDAEGGQKALSAFATDLIKLGPGSRDTITSGRQVAEMFLSIDKNSSQAKAQFVGWVESMGYSKDQANKLWAEVSKGAKPLSDMRTGLASSATASDHLANSGFFAQRGDTFRTNLREMSTWFTKTLPDAITSFGRFMAASWSTSYQQFERNLGSPVAKFFSSTLPDFFTQTIPHAAAGAWDTVYQDFMRGFGSPLASFFTKTIPGWWNNLVAGGKQAWTGTWNDFDRILWQPLSGFFGHTVPGWWNNLVAGGKQAWDNTWSAFDHVILQPLGNFFGKTVPSWWNDFTHDAKNTWDAVWGDFDRIILQPLRNFFTRTVPGWLNDTGRFFKNLWNLVWGDFTRYDLDPLRNFFTRTMPGWLNDIGRFFASLWRTVWDDFHNSVLTPMGRWFGSTLPGSIRNAFRGAINWVIDNVINKVIGFIDNDILKHLPGGLHINRVGNVASGGDVGMAAGGPFARMSGSVPGASAVDGTRIMAMGGEYMVRQPARMALEAHFGRGFMNWLNQFDQHSGAGSRGTMDSQQMRPGVNYAAGGELLAAPMMASGGLVNPIGPGLRPERVDMGVDYGGSGALRALGAGRITNVYNSGWPGGTFIGLQLNPPYGSGYWYYAEDINPLVRVNQGVSAGQHIANATGGPSGIEVGWAAPPGTGETEAHAQGQDKAGLAHGDPGAYPTAWGVAASNLIKSLGGPAGIISGKIQGGTAGIGGAIAAVWQTVEGLLNAAGNGLGSLIKPLARWVSGGAGELLKLARQGAASIFGAIWDHSVKPLADLIPGDTIPGALAQGSAAEIRQGIVNFLKGQDQNARSQAASSGGGSIGPVSGPADAGPGQAENYAKGRLASFGWGPSQFPPLQSLWTRESGWNRFARNPSSGAYGIPQALPPTKLPFAGQAGGGSHASPQIDWGLGYIKNNPMYGTPSAAWAHELAHGWYPHGGVVGGDGVSLMASGGSLPDWTALNTAIRAEMSAMDVMQAAHLPSRGPTMAQRHAFTDWQKALWDQQLKTIGLGHRPPGAYAALVASAGSPAKMTAGQWQAFTSDLSYLTKEEAGPGAGGINPPGTPPNSGHVAWQYLRGDWQHLLDELRIADARAVAAKMQWGSRYSLTGVGGASGTPGTAGQTGTDSPEWDAAAAALDAAVRAESGKFWAFMGATLPKAATATDRKDWAAWRAALEKQQYKTIGLGHSGAYQGIQERLKAPGTIPAGQWHAFISDVDYLLREEEGSGAGGINPPGTPRNSGWPAYHYHQLFWKDLRADLKNVEAKAKAAQNAWGTLYGPGHVPYTPGPHVPPPAAPVGGLVNVMPEATMGGPSVPVHVPPTVAPDMGFAAGGGLDQVTAMFSGSLNPGGVMLPVVARYGIPDSVLRLLSGISGGSSGPADYPRRLSEAGGRHVGPALNVEQLNINNPLPQRPSDSIAHAGNRLAFLAGRMG